MKTIKLLLAATLIMVGVSLNAQDNQFTFGVKAGVNMSNMDIKHIDTKVKFGYNIGVTVDYAINQDWYILSGLQYTTKGTKIDYSIFEAKLNAAYLQLPIHAGYKLEIAPETKLVFHAGPYFAYGINGKAKASTNYFEELEDEWGIEGTGKSNTFDTIDRFDMGLGLGVGIEFGKFGLDLGWDYGLINIAKEDGTTRNGNAYLTVGYKF